MMAVGSFACIVSTVFPAGIYAAKDQQVHKHSVDSCITAENKAQCYVNREGLLAYQT